MPDFSSNPKWQQDLLKQHNTPKSPAVKPGRKYPVKPKIDPNWQQALTESREGTDFEGYPFNVKPKKNPFLPELEPDDPNNMSKIFDPPPEPEPEPEPEPTGDNPWREIDTNNVHKEQEETKDDN